MSSNEDDYGYSSVSYMKVGDAVKPAPELMTEDELITFLRIPEISKAKDYRNVIDNLIRMRDLPRIQISNRLLFPRQAILEWIKSVTTKK